MRKKIVEMFELCFTPAPLSEDGQWQPPTVQIYRYATKGRFRRVREEGPLTTEHPAQDRIDAEAFALTFNMVRTTEWTATSAGYDTATLARLGR